jgi:hypothetical protein
MSNRTKLIREIAEKAARENDKYDVFNDLKDKPFPEFSDERLNAIWENVRKNGYIIEYGIIYLAAAFAIGEDDYDLVKFLTAYAAIGDSVNAVPDEYIEDFSPL